MIFKDVNSKIYIALSSIYRSSTSYHDLNLGWKHFIKCQDLGIECAEVHKEFTVDCGSSFQKLGGRYDAEYKIVNEKKWALNRLKYGI